MKDIKEYMRQTNQVYDYFEHIEKEMIKSHDILKEIYMSIPEYERETEGSLGAKLNKAMANLSQFF